MEILAFNYTSPPRKQTYTQFHMLFLAHTSHRENVTLKIDLFRDAHVQRLTAVARVVFGSEPTTQRVT
jgi:hypothetical protein